MDAGDINPKLPWGRIVPDDTHMEHGFRCGRGAAGMAALQRHSGIATTEAATYGKPSTSETNRRAGALRNVLTRQGKSHLDFVESSEATLASNGSLTKNGERAVKAICHLGPDVEFRFTRKKSWKGSEKGELSWIRSVRKYPYKEIKDPQDEQEESDSESEDSLANSD